jgi:hypothetical protein
MMTPVIIACLIALCSSLQLLLTKPETCLGFEAEEDGDRLMFTYHHNPNMGTANMKIFDDADNLIA